MANFWDAVGQTVYENIIGHKDTHIEEFTLLNAWSFLIDAAMKNHRIAMGAIQINKKGERYEIVQIALNKNMDVVRKTGEHIIGRKIYAYMLDDDITAYMSGKEAQIMQLDVLKKNN